MVRRYKGRQCPPRFVGQRQEEMGSEQPKTHRYIHSLVCERQGSDPRIKQGTEITHFRPILSKAVQVLDLCSSEFVELDHALHLS